MKRKVLRKVSMVEKRRSEEMPKVEALQTKTQQSFRASGFIKASKYHKLNKHGHCKFGRLDTPRYYNRSQTR